MHGMHSQLCVRHEIPKFSKHFGASQDHNPHTLAKRTSSKPPPVFYVLERRLPLMLKTVNGGRLTLEDLEQKLHQNQRRIFWPTNQTDTCIKF